MKKKLFKFGALFFVVFFAHAMIHTQMIPFLIKVGYSPKERGLILSFYALVAMFGQLVMGYLCDKFHTIKRFLIATTLVLSVFILLIFILDQKNFMMHLLLIGNGVGFINISLNLLETWVVEVDDLYPHFGSIRSLGSFGWATSSLITGFIIVNYNYRFMVSIAVILNLISIVLMFRLQDAQKPASIPLSLKDIGMVFHNKQYVLLVLSYTLAFIISSSDGVTVTDFIFFLNGSEKDIGTKWFVQAISELPVMFFSGMLLDKLKGKRMMILGAFGLGLRFIGYSLFQNIHAIIAFSSLQMISFPLLLVSQKELIMNETPKHLISTGQMVAIAFSSGFAAIVSPLLVGFLSEFLPSQMILRSFGLFMIVPIFLMFMYKPSKPALD